MKQQLNFQCYNMCKIKTISKMTLRRFCHCDTCEIDRTIDFLVTQTKFSRGTVQLCNIVFT